MTTFEVMVSGFGVQAGRFSRRLTSEEMK